MLTPREIDRLARQGFSYRPDPAGDEWRSHAEDVLAGRPWSGDCDDLASTALDLAGRHGYPLSDRYRIFVSLSGGKVVDHMVAAIRSRASLWIVGDTNGEAVPLGAFGYRIVFHQRMDEAREDLIRRGRP